MALPRQKNKAPGATDPFNDLPYVPSSLSPGFIICPGCGQRVDLPDRFYHKCNQEHLRHYRQDMTIKAAGLRAACPLARHLGKGKRLEE